MTTHYRAISNIVDFNMPIFIVHTIFCGSLLWFTGNKLANEPHTDVQNYVFIYACSIEIIYVIARFIQIKMRLGFSTFSQTKYFILSIVSVLAHFITLVLILIYFYDEQFVGFFFGSISYFGKLIIKSSYENSHFHYDCIVTSQKYHAEYDRIANYSYNRLLIPHIQTPLISPIPIATTISFNAQSDECSICLIQFDQSDDVVELSCKHTFHRSCVLRWFREKTDCPVCRQSARS
jgi:hypothetical protein